MSPPAVSLIVALVMAAKSSAVSLSDLLEVHALSMPTVVAAAYDPARKSEFLSFTQTVLHPPPPPGGGWRGCEFREIWAEPTAMVRAVQLSSTAAGALALWAQAEQVEAIGERNAAIKPSKEDGQRPTALGRELARRRITDQAWRAAAEEQPHSPAAEEVIVWRTGARLCEVDHSNIVFLKDTLRSHGWPRISVDGAAASKDAWLLAQHADDDPAFQSEVLNAISGLIPTHEASGKDYAYLYDRVAAASKRPQLYGTQFTESAGGCLEPKPIADASNVDARRRAVGMPALADYAHDLATAYKRPLCPIK